VEITIVEF